MSENLVLTIFFGLSLLFGALAVNLYRREKKSSVQAGWIRLITGNALLLFWLVSLGLLMGEFYFRFVCDTTDALAYTKVSRRWLERYWMPNAAGVRDNIGYSLGIKPGVRRITFVGDSFTAGHGVKNVEDRFVNRLRRQHSEWELHCLAELGMETGDQIRYLQNCLQRGYALDQVVLVYCLNDVSDLVPQWAETRERILGDANRGGWWEQNSYLINTLAHRYRAMRDPDIRNYFQFVRDTAAGPVWEEQKRRLTRFKAIVESHGGRLLVVTFPFLNQRGPTYGFQAVHDSLRQFWHEKRVPHLDLLNVYDSQPSAKLTVNSFDAHPNEFAHALAATAIEEFITAQLGK
jgi:hypothetical protein